MAKMTSIAEARKAARRVQMEEARARAERDKANVNDIGALLMARSRHAAVDEWEAGRAAEIAAQAGRKREDQKAAASAAVERLRERGETRETIARLAGLDIADLRPYWRAVAVNSSEALGEEAGPAGPVPDAPARSPEPSPEPERPALKTQTEPGDVSG